MLGAKKVGESVNEDVFLLLLVYPPTISFSCSRILVNSFLGQKFSAAWGVPVAMRGSRIRRLRACSRVSLLVLLS